MEDPITFTQFLAGVAVPFLIVINTLTVGALALIYGFFKLIGV